MTLRLRRSFATRPFRIHGPLLVALLLVLHGGEALGASSFDGNPSPVSRGLELEDPAPLEDATLELRTPLPASTLEPFVAQLVTASGGGYTFFLEPVSARDGAFVLKTQGAGGGFQTVSPTVAKTYRGTVLEIPGSKVAASLLSNGIHALILVPDGDDLFIVPTSSAARAPGAEGQAYSMVRVPRAADLPGPFQSLEGMAGVLGGEPAECSVDGLCVAELALDSTWALYSTQGSSVEAALDLGEGAVNMASLRFEDQFNISHRITGMVVRTSQADDPYFGASNGLAVMSQEWEATDHGDIPRDHIHLLGYGSGGQTVQAGVICSTFNNRSFSAASSLSFVSVGTLIHELGHAWGSDHDSCGIMMPVGIDPTRPFCGDSDESIADFRDLLSPSCLDTLIPDGLIFADGFEAGDLAGWPVTFDPEGRLQVISGGDVLLGSYSLAVDLEGSGAAWVRDELATLEPSYKVRFLLDARGMLQGILSGQEGPTVRVYEGTGTQGAAIVALEARRVSGLTPLEMRIVTQEDGGTASTPWVGVYQAANGPVEIIVKWKASTAPGADDGQASLKVEGSTVASLTGLDSDSLRVDAGSIGVVAAPTGVFKKDERLLLDDFQSRRNGPF